jgi:hypothetical protein
VTVTLELYFETQGPAEVEKSNVEGVSRLLSCLGALLLEELRAKLIVSFEVKIMMVPLFMLFSIVHERCRCGVQLIYARI